MTSSEFSGLKSRRVACESGSQDAKANKNICKKGNLSRRTVRFKLQFQEQRDIIGFWKFEENVRCTRQINHPLFLGRYPGTC